MGAEAVVAVTAVSQANTESTPPIPWGRRTKRSAPPAGRKRWGRSAPDVLLGGDEQAELVRRVRASSTPQCMALRCRLVLLAAAGWQNRQISRELGLSENTVSKWRRRFATDRLAGLSDRPRSGRPSPFSAAEKARVLQKAVEHPRENGRPITHWSSRELASLVKSAGLVDSIHPSTVGRWLREADLKPYQIRMWLKSPDPEFEERMLDVVDHYRRAPTLARHGIPVFCIDEKTSIQALERLEQPLRPGQSARLGHRYKRHGTTNLLGVLQVASGKVWGRFAPDRTAETFRTFVAEVVASVPDAPQVHVVCDQLNTHYAETVCELVADLCCVELPWSGRKLKSVGAERRRFLMDPNKRIVFHFTPTHASWLDQIELWFSVLTRKVLARGSFRSVQKLQQAIVEFIDYHNRFRARPYRWTYTGAACRR